MRGHWEIERNLDLGNVYIREACGTNGRKGRICRMWNDRSLLEEYANLIAAAPNLLEALKECEWSDGGGCPQCAATRGEPHQSKCILRNALDKAEGK